MAYTLGIDIGSTTSKCVLLQDGVNIVSKSLVKAGTGTKGPQQAFEEVIQNGNINCEDVSFIMATGYGRTTFEKMDSNMSELSAHAKGVNRIMPEARTIIDIGGQDAKVIKLNANGVIDNFIMNDKCAAGTGRFLDVMAGILQIDIDEMGDYALKADNIAKISSTCTVFAESEVISQLSKGVDLASLIAGICQSVASRTAALAKRIGLNEQVCMSGGVARNSGVRNALSNELNLDVQYVPDAQYMGALGAAISAYDKLNKN